ncbi:MAG: CHAT domain-containing protein, partial [Bacteroidales bacterium]|nr:CHAT domain-containing protein [Bacteroidales bacterium]
KKLIIIPDGKLAFIPFEVLLSRFPGDKSFNYSSLPYLIRDYTINYSYSATLLFAGTSPDKIPGNKLLAFAPAYEYGDTKNSNVEELYRTYNIGGELLPLLGTKNEVNIISGLVRGDVFSGVKATEKNLKSLQAGYKILHLALHTFIDNENPMYSKLVFTQDGDTTEDGLLNTWEIYNMDLNAEMVVLSACNTGSGKLRRGEGIISLARGFKYAGVPGIVMTLWSVGDDSSADLMGSFYKYLSRSNRKDEALRYAKLDYLESVSPTEAHPYFWAGYVTIGDAKPVLKKKNILLKSIIAGTIILLLGMVVMYKFYSRFPDSFF